MTRTAIQASATKTAVFDGSAVDISGLEGGYRVFLKISSLSANTGQTPVVVFNFEDVEAADFTTPRIGPTFYFEGAIDDTAGCVVSFSKREFGSLPVGDTNGKIRLRLTRISGTGASCTYESWIETA